MNAHITQAKAAIGIAALLLAAGLGGTAQAQTSIARTQAPTSAQPVQPQNKPITDKELLQSMGNTGANASASLQSPGAVRPEATVGNSAQQGNGGMQQQQAKPGFDNKPPAGLKADCHRPQGGVDASGGENVSTASKNNKTCTDQPTTKADGK
jgi:hypothetical protein